MIYIGNLKDTKQIREGTEVYVGRGQNSPLGNPFELSKHNNDRDEVIRLYAQWLYIHKEDPEVNQKLEYIAEIAEQGDVWLMCYCYPEKCHARIIIVEIRRRMRERIARHRRIRGKTQ